MSKNHGTAILHTFLKTTLDCVVYYMQLEQLSAVQPNRYLYCTVSCPLGYE